MKKKSNVGLIIILVLVIIGLGGYIAYNKLYNNDNKISDNKYLDDKKDNNTKNDTISVNPDELYNYLVYTHKQSFYSDKKITAKDLASELLLYNVMRTMYIKDSSSIKDGVVSEVSDYGKIKYVNISDISKYEEKMYDTSKIALEEPEAASSATSQVAEIYRDYNNQDRVYYYYCSIKDYEWEGDCSYIKEKRDGNILMEYVKYEVDGDYVYLYEEGIANSLLSEGATSAVLTISKLDKTGKVEFDSDINKDLSYYKNNYSEYVNTFKHTFKITNDSEIKYQYVSSEPIK